MIILQIGLQHILFGVSHTADAVLLCLVSTRISQELVWLCLLLLGPRIHHKGSCCIVLLTSKCWSVHKTISDSLLTNSNLFTSSILRMYYWFNHLIGTQVVSPCSVDETLLNEIAMNYTSLDLIFIRISLAHSSLLQTLRTSSSL